MRLDLFLKATRISPRRTVAQKLCDAGLVFLNGVKVKSSHIVRVGDEITIHKRNRITKLRVLAVPTVRQTTRKDAGTLFEIVSEVAVNDEI